MRKTLVVIPCGKAKIWHKEPSVVTRSLEISEKCGTHRLLSALSALTLVLETPKPWQTDIRVQDFECNLNPVPYGEIGGSTDKGTYN